MLVCFSFGFLDMYLLNLTKRPYREYVFICSRGFSSSSKVNGKHILIVKEIGAFNAGPAISLRRGPYEILVSGSFEVPEPLCLVW